MINTLRSGILRNPDLGRQAVPQHVPHSGTGLSQNSVSTKFDWLSSLISTQSSFFQATASIPVRVLQSRVQGSQGESKSPGDQIKEIREDLEVYLWPIWKCIYLGIFERIKSLDRSSRSAKRSDPVQLVLWFACLCLWCLPFDQHQHFWNLKKRNLFIDFLYIFYPGFQTMLHLGLGLSRLTLASRAAQQASVVSNGALALNQQSLKALHTTPKLDLRISGAL